MKKWSIGFLVVIFCSVLSSCSSSNQKAFDSSKIAYDSIDKAYEITESFGSDIYEAWRVAIYDDDEILEGGVSYLASELSLSEEEVLDGLVYTAIVTVGGEDWDKASQEDKDNFYEKADLILKVYEDSLFSFCTQVVVGAYIMNGEAEIAKTSINEAKSTMKELSEQYSDYEHYPSLKEYFTTTSSYFDFCSSPTGSFEQVKTTINDYRNTARKYKSDLDFIFED